MREEKLTQSEIDVLVNGNKPIRCGICFCLSVDADKYYYKWADAAQDGMDIDGFCCGECAHLPPLEQLQLLKDTLSAKYAERVDI